MTWKAFEIKTNEGETERKLVRYDVRETGQYPDAESIELVHEGGYDECLNALS